MMTWQVAIAFSHVCSGLRSQCANVLPIHGKDLPLAYRTLLRNADKGLRPDQKEARPTSAVTDSSADETSARSSSRGSPLPIVIRACRSSIGGVYVRWRAAWSVRRLIDCLIGRSTCQQVGLLVFDPACQLSE